ncbi:hypothetical protein FJZ31_01830 [Candidatus Poribacteria bacterium]|nr:hypothetical protein [Candidatus Poribacteria bacterium]
MSMRLTKIQALDGSEIYIQYDEDESDELQAVGYIDDIAERTKKFKETMVSTIRSYSETLLNAVQEGMPKIAPAKVTLEFGLQLGGEAGVPFVTKGTAQANFKVTIEWNLNKA